MYVGNMTAAMHLANAKKQQIFRKQSSVGKEPYWKVWQLHARDFYFEGQMHAEYGHCLPVASQ